MRVIMRSPAVASHSAESNIALVETLDKEREEEQRKLREEETLVACLDGQHKDLPIHPEEDDRRAEREAIALAAAKDGVDVSLPAPPEKSNAREKRLTNVLEQIEI